MTTSSARTPSGPSTDEFVPVVVIGAGQAGLSVSWFLGHEGIDHVVLEADSPVHAWRDTRWDRFTLVTPNWHCRLPGRHYDGPEPDGFMTRDELADWLEDWVASFNAPVRTRTRATKLERLDADRLVVDVEDSEGTHRIVCSDVVIATGGYPIPVIPPYAHSLDRSVHQVHSEDYRHPDQLPEGAVLVVGSGQSGCQIAEDLHLAGRQVHLAVGNAPRVARTYRGRDCMTWLAEMGVYDIGSQEFPGGRVARDKTNHYVTGRDGGRDIDLRQFAAEGMRLYGHLVDGRDAALRFAPDLTACLDHADSVYNSICGDIDAWIDRQGIAAPRMSRYEPVWTPPYDPTELDLRAEGITSIIWSIGFRPDYAWIQLPAFDGGGHPMQNRGITAVPGLSFIGLPWMHTWGSGRFLGLEQDAAHVAAHIVERQRGLTATDPARIA
ncbi:MSMEG_0569 family flavin-dependent oxidoreductase [Raineyella sp. LH-20]|uniref:MSMEG_0569 family flavin-dependent oxidoreductase n=1 Tax=Raineyella sp. LH-20 TaxID=3081204 RepID=UPI002954117C|nr:MSMEG_0569 family flavin-dependent oxidoreductase [Raineyella sp. LH-20]WOP19407.1 MSMEG_0569 family flavin-dependent oxidoreductase [Raineyella sp. LH-20]